MLRLPVPCSGWLSVVCGPTVAFAQQPGQGPPMPMAVDLAKVPVGKLGRLHDDRWGSCRR